MELIEKSLFFIYIDPIHMTTMNIQSTFVCPTGGVCANAARPERQD
jgi:hypothetical protein